MRLRSAGAALAAAALIAACAPRPAPPAPMPPPRPAPPLPPEPAPPAPPVDWQDASLTAGDWRLTGTREGASAIYQTSAGPVFQIVCDQPGRLGLAVPDGNGAAMTIRTTFGERAIAAGALPAADPLFDQMAFSRGRLLVRAPGVPDRVLPTWPELARVIEECREQ